MICRLLNPYNFLTELYLYLNSTTKPLIMKKLVLLLALTFTTSIVLTSCREKSGIEKAADDVEDAVDDLGD